jgi:hypothetical protein
MPSLFKQSERITSLKKLENQHAPIIKWNSNIAVMERFPKSINHLKNRSNIKENQKHEERTKQRI